MYSPAPASHSPLLHSHLCSSPRHWRFPFRKTTLKTRYLKAAKALSFQCSSNTEDVTRAFHADPFPWHSAEPRTPLEQPRFHSGGAVQQAGTPGDAFSPLAAPKLNRNPQRFGHDPRRPPLTCRAPPLRAALRRLPHRLPPPQGAPHAAPQPPARLQRDGAGLRPSPGPGATPGGAQAEPGRGLADVRGELQVSEECFCGNSCP